MLNLEGLQKRRDELSEFLTTLTTDLDIYKDRTKIIKKEISNAKGALMEINRMIEEEDGE